MASNLNIGREVFRGKSSAYVHDDLTKNWIDRGVGGMLIMYHDEQNAMNYVTIKWSKKTQEFWWTISALASKMKPKGERAWIMKATSTQSNEKEILALRFATTELANTFIDKYREIFPSTIRAQTPPSAPPFPHAYIPPMMHMPPIMPVNPHQWNCEMCTLWNSNTNIHCDACNSLKPNIKPDDEINIEGIYELTNYFIDTPDGKKWPCQVCTHPNAMDKVKCEICGMHGFKNAYNIKPILTKYNVTRLEHEKQILEQQYSTELTITGYCRNIEQLLNTNIVNRQNVIIPTGVIHLCFMFYVNNPWDFIVNILLTLDKDMRNGVYDQWDPMRNGPYEEWILLKRLQKIAQYILNEEHAKYHSLDLFNSKLRYEILKYKGTLIFLNKLGFILSSKTNDKLIWNCHFKFHIIESCIACLTEKCKQLYQQTNGFMHTTNDDHRWKCKNCTCMNSNSRERCTICQTKKKILATHTMTCLICGNMHNALFNDNLCNNCNQLSTNRTNITYESSEDFENVASNILQYNDHPYKLFSTLKTVTKKLRKDNPRYRKLDLTNRKVIERLLSHDSVLEFLMLLGYEYDAFGTTLICQQKPSETLIQDAIETLNKYMAKLNILNETAKNMMLSDSIMRIEEVDDDKLTLDEIIKYGTSENSESCHIMDVILMTHKMFTTSINLMKSLTKRVMNSMTDDIVSKIDHENQTIKRIHLKTIKSLRDWMKQYWNEDFNGNIELEHKLNVFVQCMLNYDKNYNWVNKLCEAVQNDIIKLKNKCTEEKINETELENCDEKELKMVDNCSGEELADQITLMDWKLFHNIKPREWVDCCDKNIDSIPDNIALFLDRNKQLSYYVISKILGESSPKKRSKIIKRFIRVCEQLKDTHNYQSFCVVYNALHNAIIHRLKSAWSHVHERWKNKFDEWSKIFCKDDHYRNLRQLMRKAKNNQPCIPHINLMIDSFSLSTGLNDCIDIKPYIAVVDKISFIQQYQNRRYDDLMKPNAMLQKLLLSEFNGCNEYDECTLWDWSTEVKHKDRQNET
eukprot:183648_1